MRNPIKISVLFTMFIMCFNFFCIRDTTAQVNDTPAIESAGETYTFETIDVPGVDFLALTASNDFEAYAGYTKSADGKKDVAFTLIDGVFTTYDFRNSQNTYFYALSNDRRAAGHYQDSNGLYHGVILEDGELRQYDFPNAVQTEIYSINNASGVLTGNFIDASGVRRGFSGERVIEVPEATATYANLTTDSGAVLGSYIDSDGIYRTYVHAPDGRFIFADALTIPNLKYVFVHGLNDVGISVLRAQAVDDIPRTYVGRFAQIHEFQVPGSVITEGWHISQKGAVVGYYDSPDGRRHGFIARPIGDTAALVEDQPDVDPTRFPYTFETIDVPGVDFLALTASSDFEDYAGYTKSADGEKDVAFTLIDGVFRTYDFPGSQNTYFYALGNNGTAAGYYEDSDGLHRGVFLDETGELHQRDFPGAAQTEIFGISDATGALTGNWTDASGVRRGFSGETVIEVPEATATYADFVSGSGTIVGSYIDSDGKYHIYGRAPDGRFVLADILKKSDLEYLFTHGVNDVGVTVVRAKAVDDVPRTYVGRFGQPHELQVPGSVSTEGYNINQDNSIVGHYTSADGRIHGFIAKLATKAESDRFSNTYTVTLTKGLNMLSVPLAPHKPMTAKSLAGLAGATVVISLDAEKQRFIGWTPGAPNDGFPIEGGQGYIVNVPQARNFAFVGSHWTHQTEAAAPAISTQLPQDAWAFVVSGHLEGKLALDRYTVIVRNLRTNRIITAPVQDNYFAAATADLSRRSIIKVGDVVEIRLTAPDGNLESHARTFTVTPKHIANAVLSVQLDGIGQPNQNQLLQNYPNPFNPETWIPYQLSQDSPVSISIHDSTGKMIRTLPLGYQTVGFYNSRSRAAYWDGRNAQGEPVASGVYFYTLTAGEFTATRKMLIRK